MKRDMMDIICCPTCKSDLTLTVSKEDEKEVIEGQLKCSNCDVEYPINEGIPNLLPKNLE
jgi:uncharacterized protein YbaR (Trm112 family)